MPSVDAPFWGRPWGRPCTPGVRAVASPCRLLGSHREHRLAALVEVPHAGGEVFAWGVTVRGPASCARRTCPRHTVLSAAPPVTDPLRTDPVPWRLKRGGQATDARAWPPPWRLRRSTRRRVHQGGAIPEPRRIPRHATRASRSRTPQALHGRRRLRGRVALHLAEAGANRLAGPTGRQRYGTDATASTRQGCGRSPAASRQLIQHRLKRLERLGSSVVWCHGKIITPINRFGYFISRRLLRVCPEINYLIQVNELVG